MNPKLPPLQRQIGEAAACIALHLKAKPEIALILGSGLGELVNSIDISYVVKYAEIPHFQASGAPGHLGQLVFGTLLGKQVVAMQGRLHGYEGNTPQQVVFPLRVMHALGAKTLITTNAAGAINANWQVGDIMLITDHINFTGENPLTFSQLETAYDPCPDMSFAYTPALRELAKTAAEKTGIMLREGVYLGLRGPSFETPAEIRAFRVWGADAVGMSTVHEVIAAASCGMRIVGFSLLTNMAAGIESKPITGEHVLEVSSSVGSKLAAIVDYLVESM
ncbi:MAG: purine-nucleoside phosphorylase [Coriobacteriaceae bacterium]|nr:purine-nucleoside phosphorylase [Coriobacteriaceae bacterium]